MTRLNRLLTCAVAGALVAAASCGRKGSSPVKPDAPDTPDTKDFDLVTGCSGTCVGGLLTMVYGFQDIIRWVAEGKSSTAPGRSLDLETGAFGIDLDMDGASGNEVQVRGTITPISEEIGDKSCDNGMLDYVNKVCIAEWDMWYTPTGATMGNGTYSIVFLGWAGAPELTPSFRVTIAKENTLIGTVDGCKLVITGLQLMLRPFADPELMSAMVSFTMKSEGVGDEVTGDLIYGYDPSATSQSMSLTGKYTTGGTTKDVSCSVNLDTFEVKCS